MGRIKSMLLAAAGPLLATCLPAEAPAAGPLDQPGYAKSLTCSACHGAGGNSRSDAMPILAGLSTAYFKKQIDAYATGARPSPEMEPYAKMVQNLGVDDIAAYFAAQKMEPTPIGAPADAVARGRAAAAQCTVCHGADGKGDAAKLIPSLAGQPPGYLRDQMLLFKANRRNPGDASLNAVKAFMQTIPDQSFADLAAYYSSLR
jgi:cytochrome c553